jgi:uncharacterized protein YjiS (DUF1127 family)
MAFATHTSPAPFAAIAIFKLINLFETTVKAVSTWNNNRKTVNILCKLSDDVLSDIGLIRSDITNQQARF